MLSLSGHASVEQYSDTLQTQHCFLSLPSISSIIKI